MITSFKLFESNLEIEKICKNLGIEDFQIVDGLVNVLGNVNISAKKLKKIPVKFGRVEGYFWCHNNQLTSLEGSPQSVGRDFDCYNNQLTHLEGGPRSVGGYFSCSNNQLTHLEGAPRSVGGYFSCSRNQLTHLEGTPRSVGGYFNCSNNQLASLEGGPRSVGGYFSCSNNQLTTLEGSPRSVGGDFYCSNNQLTSLEGAPQSVGGNFYCNDNQIKDFKVPEYSLNEEIVFECGENPIFEIYKLFNTPKCIDLINEYEVIGDGVISRVRLEEVFLELGMEVPNLKIDFHASKNWKLV